MKRTFLIGISAAVIGGLGLWVAGLLGLSFQNTVLGVGAGVIAATVKIGSPLERLGGFLIGFLLGVLFIAMRLGLLPGGDSIAGITVALVIILLVITLLSGFTANRISYWSMLLGAIAFVGGFIPICTATPWIAADQLPSSFFSLLAMAAIGFLTVVPAELLPDKSAKHSDVAPKPEEPEPGAATSEPQTSLDEMIGGAK